MITQNGLHITCLCVDWMTTKVGFYLRNYIWIFEDVIGAVVYYIYLKNHQFHDFKAVMKFLMELFIRKQVNPCKQQVEQIHKICNLL